MSCAIGIGSIYILQASWFVAWLALDQRRIETRRDGCFPCCIEHGEDWKPWAFSQKETGKMLMAKFAGVLRNGWSRALVLIITLALLGVGTWGTLLIRQEFDPVLFLPGDSYLRRFIDSQKLHYPQNGWSAEVYTGPIPGAGADLEKELFKLDSLVLEMEEMSQDGNVIRGKVKKR